MKTTVDERILEEISTAYHDAIGAYPSVAIAKFMLLFLEKHSVEELLQAIEITAFAPRPTPYYLRAVLLNWGKPRQPRQQNPALDYEQRDWSQIDFDARTSLENARKILESIPVSAQE